MFKRCILLLLTLVTIIAFPGCRLQNEEPVSGKLYVNDVLIDEEYTVFIKRGLFRKPAIQIPVCKMLEGMGYSANWVSETCVELTKEDIVLRLDLIEQSLTIVTDPLDTINYIGLFPDEDPGDLMVQVVDHDVLVNLNYVRDRGFKALYIDMDIHIDYKNNCVYINSDGIYHPPYWLEY